MVIMGVIIKKRKEKEALIRMIFIDNNRFLKIELP